MSEPSEPSGTEEEYGNGQDADTLLDVLSSPLDNGDGLTAALNRRPRAKLPSLTVVLVVIVVASGGFIGGILLGKHYGSSGSGGLASRFAGFPGVSASTSAGSTGSGSPTRISGLGGAGGAGALAGGNATVGTIKLVDGSTVYVQTTAGDIVPVTTSSGTKVTVSSTVPVKDLQPGETVIVEGSKNSSGGVSATTISQASGVGLGG